MCGSWLQAIPNKNLGLVMSAEKSMIALHLWLGISVFLLSHLLVDVHVVPVIMFSAAGSGNLRIKRHDALCDIVFHTLLEDHSGTREEQHCGGYDNSRLGDVYHPDFLLGRPAYFDITIRNSFQPSYVIHSAHYAGAATAAGEIEKDDRHMANVEVAGGLLPSGC